MCIGEDLQQHHQYVNIGKPTVTIIPVLPPSSSVPTKKILAWFQNLDTDARLSYSTHKIVSLTFSHTIELYSKVYNTKPNGTKTHRLPRRILSVGLLPLTLILLSLGLSLLHSLVRARQLCLIFATRRAGPISRRHLSSPGKIWHGKLVVRKQKRGGGRGTTRAGGGLWRGVVRTKILALQRCCVAVLLGHFDHASPTGGGGAVFQLQTVSCVIKKIMSDLPISPCVRRRKR